MCIRDSYYDLAEKDLKQFIFYGREILHGNLIWVPNGVFWSEKVLYVQREKNSKVEVASISHSAAVKSSVIFEYFEFLFRFVEKWRENST